MDIQVMFFFLAGLALLVVGAEFLVRGASRLAAFIGISPLVIGLTVVAYGTSAPELAVSVMSANAGQPDIAMGNVVGSNIFNVLFILGVSALITPLVVSRQLIRVDVPVMVLVSIVMLMFSVDGRVDRAEGFVLFAGVVLYTGFQIVMSRKEKETGEFIKEFGDGKGRTSKDWAINIFFIAAGVAILVLGSGWLVESAVDIARSLGVNELVIGLTIIAAGTSLPEVATSVLASIKGERDIAVGNIVGSNIFNILSVLGLSSALSPEGIAVSPSALSFDIPVAIGVAVACMPVFFTGRKIARWEGALFLFYYVMYTVYIFLESTHHQGFETFRFAILAFVLPLTVLTLLTVVVRTVREERKANLK